MNAHWKIEMANNILFEDILHIFSSSFPFYFKNFIILLMTWKWIRKCQAFQNRFKQNVKPVGFVQGNGGSFGCLLYLPHFFKSSITAISGRSLYNTAEKDALLRDRNAFPPWWTWSALRLWQGRNLALEPR